MGTIMTAFKWALAILLVIPIGYVAFILFKKFTDSTKANVKEEIAVEKEKKAQK
ncbi:MAG: hypothetical protein MJ145_03140 [Clostridia bacterium]|nr:hypothetical protein [Clostridia bacterium]